MQWLDFLHHHRFRNDVRKQSLGILPLLPFHNPLLIALVTEETRTDSFTL